MADGIWHMADGISAINKNILANMPTFGTIMFNKINIAKNNIPHTPSKMDVLESITFSHTPEEAMSVGLVKACVP